MSHLESCLGGISKVGRKDSHCGSNIHQKLAIWRNIGGNWLSKDPGIERYHRCWDWPKIVITVLRECRKGNCSRGFAGKRNNRKREIVRMGVKKGELIKKYLHRPPNTGNTRSISPETSP